MSDAGPALLVVDDNDDNRYTLTRRLKRQGYENVEIAEDGRQAIDTLAAGNFDLVLLDIMMPEMNGYQVLEHMKADMTLRDIPVIMISALDDMESVIRCVELGAEDYLPKPFNATLLKARVGACLEKKRLRDEEASYMERLAAEKRRADQLLHAIMPSGAVQELKATNKVTPRRFEDVAVLFCDVVSFTKYCDENPAEQVVSELNALVVKFEEIVAGHGMEKIKTIGDAFMATAGLLLHVDQPLQAAVRCGLDMVEAAKTSSPWQVRVGIEHGPVIAGVMGQRQFAYDLWGDTVNVASRIAGVAEPGTVAVSGTNWVQVRNDYRGKSLGQVELKGKGSVELIACYAA